MLDSELWSNIDSICFHFSLRTNGNPNSKFETQQGAAEAGPDVGPRGEDAAAGDQRGGAAAAVHPPADPGA